VEQKNLSSDCWTPAPVVNFRDVGAFVNLILGHDVVGEHRLLRGGTIKHLPNLASVGAPATVLCLKNGPNAGRPGVSMLHHPRPDTSECYQTSERGTRNWLRAIVRSLAEPPVNLPLYVHCHSGRDRTGVVVAALLKILKVPAAAIVEEYMLSDGTDKTKICEALVGLEDVDSYFPGRHMIAIRALLL
jgi:protein-tyrosine phosphatase